MNWQRAYSAMMDGQSVTRVGWPVGRKIFVAKSPSDICNPPPILPPDFPFPTICDKQDPPGNISLNWVPDKNDMFAMDWQIA